MNGPCWRATPEPGAGSGRSVRATLPFVPARNGSLAALGGGPEPEPYPEWTRSARSGEGATSRGLGPRLRAAPDPHRSRHPGAGRDTRDRGRHDASSRQIPDSSAVPRRTSPSSGSRRRIRFPGRGGPSHAGAMREARGDGRGQERREGAGSCRARRRRASPPPQRPTRQRARSRCSTVRPTRARRRPPPPETRSRGGRHAKNPVPAREGSP